MANFLLIAISASWLGILTSISPCPLATNIAAVSFVSKKISNPYLVFLSGVFYTIGRALAYALVGFLIVKSITSSQILALTLQMKMNMALGPLLVITGLILFDIIQIPFSGFGNNYNLQQKIEKMGLFGSFALGFIFALSFCPVSTAIFFGSLIPLAIAEKSAVTVPAIYGLATGLPVLCFAIIFAFSTKKIALIFNKITVFEIVVRKTTAAIFIIVGFYFCYTYLFL